MVKVKILNVEYAGDKKYIGKTYEAFKMKYKYENSFYYMAKVEDDNLLCVTSENCEEVDDRPMLACAVEEHPKKITMQDIMRSLGIEVGDIVRVDTNIGKTYLMCNDKYDLVLLSGNYDVKIPNVILGMVSGKHDYTVYSKSYECVQTERR